MAAVIHLLLACMLGITLLEVSGRSSGRAGRKSLRQMKAELKETYDTDVFWPGILECCKVGEKVAMKGLSCDAHEFVKHSPDFDAKSLGESMENAHVSRRTRRLLKHADICVFRYAVNFKKCCHYQESYRRELEDCGKVRSSRRRRRCQRKVHARYP